MPACAELRTERSSCTCRRKPLLAVRSPWCAPATWLLLMSRGAPFNLRSTTVHWPHVACNGHLRRCPKEVGRGSLSNTYSKQTSVPISIFWSATAVHALLATRTDPPTVEWQCYERTMDPTPAFDAIRLNPGDNGSARAQLRCRDSPSPSQAHRKGSSNKSVRAIRCSGEPLYMAC